MTRRELREQVFKVLFRVEFNEKEDMQEQLAMFFEDLPEEDEQIIRKDEEIATKYNLIIGKLPEIDEMINKVAEGWSTKRMSKVDLTIIRLAVYEIKFDESVPTGVAINEAVEIAKKFGQDESSAFVNGILAKLA